MKDLGRPSLRLRFSLGLDTEPDLTLSHRVGDPRAPSLVGIALQSGARVRSQKGVLRKDEGTEQYGVDLSGRVSVRGMGIHTDPELPRFLLAMNSNIFADTAGNGSAWDSVDADFEATDDFAATDEPGVSFAGRQGVTYVANGRSPVQVYKGGTETLSVPDLPSFDELGLDYKPEPSDILLDGFEDFDAGPDWIASVNVTISDEASIVRWGGHSMKVVFGGAGVGERVDKDLGASGTLDLSHDDYLAFWINASVEGSYLIARMSESPLGTGESGSHFFPITIGAGEVGKWKLCVWDLTGIDPGERDAIRYLRFGIPGTQACTVYLDHLIRCGPLYGDYLYAVTLYDTATGREGPLGGFRRVQTVEPNEALGAMPRRCIYIPAADIAFPAEVGDRIRLYRTLGNSDRFYRIAEIERSPVSGKWSYTDTTPDTDLTEDLALVSWPGQAPRARWLIPRGDRLLYVGGLFVASRRDPCYTALVVNQYTHTDTMSRNAFPESRIWGVEFRVSTGASGTLELVLQRTTKGGSSWVTQASYSKNAIWASSTTYRVPLIAHAGEGGDLFFSDDYDWRIAIGTSYPAGITFCAAIAPYADLGDHMGYRLLVHAPNAVFMSDLASWQMVPPLGLEDMPVDVTTGGFQTLNSADGQRIKGWCEHGSDILFGKSSRMYLWAGQTMEDIDYICVLPSKGLLVDDAIADCDGAAVWLAQDKQVYLWMAGTGQSPVMLSKEIREFFEGLTVTQLVGTTFLYWSQRVYMFMPNAPAGSRCRFYDFVEKAWYPGYAGAVLDILPCAPDRAALTPHGIYDPGPTHNCQVLKFFGAETDLGAAIGWSARCGEIDAKQVFGAAATAMRVRAYRLVVDGPAAGTVTVKVYRNRSATAAQTYTETIPAGTGLRSIERFPHATLCAGTLSFEASGSHSVAMKVHELQLWMDLAR